MTVSFSAYRTLLTDDFRNWIVSESVIIRNTGTQSRKSRIRLINLVLLRGMYQVILNHDESDLSAMYDQDGINLFVDQINLILGTDYSIAWGGALTLTNPVGGAVLTNPVGGAALTNPA